MVLWFYGQTPPPKKIWFLWFYGPKSHKNPQSQYGPYGYMVKKPIRTPKANIAPMVLWSKNRWLTIGNPERTMIIDANIFVL